MCMHSLINGRTQVDYFLLVCDTTRMGRRYHKNDINDTFVVGDTTKQGRVWILCGIRYPHYIYTIRYYLLDAILQDGWESVCS